MNALITILDNWPPLITLVIGMTMLLGGGHVLVTGAVQLASQFGVPTLIIGLTIVAFGTSAPELAFNLIAATNGNSALSFGNVIGSNIANIGLVLGLCAIVRPLEVSSQIIARELPWLLVISIITFLLCWLPPNLPGTETTQLAVARPDGFILLAGFCVFCYSMYRLARQKGDDPITQSAAKARIMERSTLIAMMQFLGGLILLVVGGKMSEIGAVGLAKSLGLSDALIGLTVVAFATSLPEICASVVATRRGYTDLAVGNVVGSNLFNLLLVLGATSTITPVPIPQNGMTDVVAMVALTAILLPVALSHRQQITRVEGIVLLLLYVAYLGYSIAAEVSAAA